MSNRRKTSGFGEFFDEKAVADILEAEGYDRIHAELAVSDRYRDYDSAWTTQEIADAIMADLEDLDELPGATYSSRRIAAEWEEYDDSEFWTTFDNGWEGHVLLDEGEWTWELVEPSESAWADVLADGVAASEAEAKAQAEIASEIH